MFPKRELGDLKFISNTEPKPKLGQFKELDSNFRVFLGIVSTTTRGTIPAPNTPKC